MKLSLFFFTFYWWSYIYIKINFKNLTQMLIYIKYELKFNLIFNLNVS